MRALTIDRAAGAFFAVFSLVVLWECGKIPFGFMAEPGPGALPMLLAFTLLACSIAVIAGGRASAPLATVRWKEGRHAAAVLGTCAFMALAMERLGYRLTIFVALLVLVGVVERKGWKAGILFAGGFAVTTYFLFHTLLRLTLPQGPFGL